MRWQKSTVIYDTEIISGIIFRELFSGIILWNYFPKLFSGNYFRLILIISQLSQIGPLLARYSQIYKYCPHLPPISPLNSVKSISEISPPAPLAASLSFRAYFAKPSPRCEAVFSPQSFSFEHAAEDSFSLLSGASSPSFPPAKQ